MGLNFSASPATVALKKERGEPIEAVANWTIHRDRYRLPTAPEYRAAGIGAKHGPQSLVCLDEGVLFVLDGDKIAAYTTKELGL